MVVSVADTGRGMAPEDIERAFEAFQQIWTQAEPIEGTGLGLYISKLLIQLHKGRIWADSQIGKGTTVHFTLPLGEKQVYSNQQVRTAERQPWPAPKYEERYCLLVSPDPLTMQVLERHLLEGTS